MIFDDSGLTALRLSVYLARQACARDRTAEEIAADVANLIATGRAMRDALSKGRPSVGLASKLEPIAKIYRFETVEQNDPKGMALGVRFISNPKKVVFVT